MGCAIELESVTNAMKAKDILGKNSYKVRLEKSTGKGKKGCAYTVYTNGDCERAEMLLTKADIKITGIS